MAGPALSLGALLCALSKMLFQQAARVCPAHSPIGRVATNTDHHIYALFENKTCGRGRAPPRAGSHIVDVGHVRAKNCFWNQVTATDRFGKFGFRLFSVLLLMQQGPSYEQRRLRNFHKLMQKIYIIHVCTFFLFSQFTSSLSISASMAFARAALAADAFLDFWSVSNSA